MMAVYAWMRRIDDLADGHSASHAFNHPGTAGFELDAFELDTDATLDLRGPLPNGPIWPALRDAAERFKLRPEHFDTMISAQRRDLGPVAMRTFDDLYAYCYGVASVVGLVCVGIWGDDGHAGVKNLAEYRGVALQLTNVLRDLGEDARRGRVYLPSDDLQRFGYSDEDLRAGVVNDSFRRLMRFQIERARSYYEMSDSLERHLTPNCRATSWAIMKTYRELLNRIHLQPEAVLRRRVRLSRWTKLMIVGNALTKRSF